MSTSTLVVDAPRSAQSWRLISTAALIVALAGAFGLRALWPMLDDAWSNIYGAFSHGYLVLALCVWLGIRYWRADPPGELRPAWSAAAALIALVLALIGMDVLFLNTPRLALLPLIFLAACALTFGWSAARTLFWPSAFLYLALPQWWAINGLLQSMTSRVVSALVNVTGLPAFVEGNFIRVPAGTFEIASGCSGLNYLVAALSLAGFYALMYLARWKSRILLLVAAGVAAMLSNFIRIYALIVIGIATDMQHYLIRVEHLYFGWAIFMVSLLPVLWFARRLDDGDASVATPEQRDVPKFPSVVVSVLPASLVAASILILPAMISVATSTAVRPTSAMPDRLGSWEVDETSSPAWQPSFVNADEERSSFVFGQSRIDVYRASYAAQTQDARLIRSENDFFGAGWRQADQMSRQIESSIPAVVESRGYFNERERLVWAWYVVAGRPTSTKVGAKLQELRGFIDRRRDAAAFAISTDCAPSCDEARQRLEEFMQVAGVSLR